LHLANMQVMVGDIPGGEHNYTRALHLAEEAGESADGVHAMALTGLGYLAVRREQFAPADKLLGEAIGMARRFYGEDDPNVALCMLRIGQMRQRRGDWEHAKVEMQKALAIDEKILAADDPAVLLILDSYADVFIDEQDWEGAKP